MENQRTLKIVLTFDEQPPDTKTLLDRVEAAIRYADTPEGLQRIEVEAEEPRAYFVEKRVLEINTYSLMVYADSKMEAAKIAKAAPVGGHSDNVVQQDVEYGTGSYYEGVETTSLGTIKKREIA